MTYLTLQYKLASKQEKQMLAFLPVSTAGNSKFYIHRQVNSIYILFILCNQPYWYKACWSSTKWTSSSSHWNLTCYDIAEQHHSLTDKKMIYSVISDDKHETQTEAELIWLLRKFFLSFSDNFIRITYVCTCTILYKHLK
jgi:hypothetical protein